MDHLQQLGELALGTRMKRIGDRLIGEVSSCFRQQEIPFDPACMALFSLLSERAALTLSEAAAALGLTHAAVSQKVSRLTKQGYIAVIPHAEDKRSKCLHITPMGRVMMAVLEPYLAVVKGAAGELLKNIPAGENFMAALDCVEGRLEDGAYARELRNSMIKHKLNDTRIASYRDEWRTHFRLLNEEWLTAHFEIEDYDHWVLGDPEKYILEPGGEIIFALHAGEVVGTVALLKEGETFEITKMAVRPDMRGRQVGKRLMLAILGRARARGVDHVYLITNTKLTAACELYRRTGFQEITPSENDRAKYRRCNARFEFRFNDLSDTHGRCSADTTSTEVRAA